MGAVVAKRTYFFAALLPLVWSFGDVRFQATAVERNDYIPLRVVRWKIPVPNNPRDRQYLEAETQRRQGLQHAALPVVQPLVVTLPVEDGGEPPAMLVLTRTPLRLIAIDLAVGTRSWFYPPHAPLRGLEDRATKPNEQPPDDLWRDTLRRRTWELGLYGQLASDGRRIYFVEVSRDWSKTPAGVFVRRGTLPEMLPPQTSRLVALELRREGWLSWSVGGQSGGNDPQLANSFVLGAPRTRNEWLYAIFQQDKQIQLATLAADSGKLAWKLKLADVAEDELSLENDLRLSGFTPLLVAGRLICPTSLGGVVCVSEKTKSIAWKWDPPPPPEADARAKFLGQATRFRLGERTWAECKLLAHDGAVVFTMPGVASLVCLEIDSGKVRWRVDRGDALFAVGIHDDHVVLAGQRAITARRLTDGSTAWTAELPKQQVPSGRGFVHAGVYHQPLTGSQLMRIDLATGERIDVVDMPATLGNLAIHEATIIAHGPSEAASYHAVGPLRKRVDARLKRNAADAQALGMRGVLAMQDGDFAAAIEYFQASLKQHPNDFFQNQLIDALAVGLRSNFAKYHSTASELESAILSSPKQFAIRRALAEGFLARGDTNAAWRMWLKLADSDSAAADSLRDDSHTIEVDPQTTATRQRWLQNMLRRIHDRSTPPHPK